MLGMLSQISVAQSWPFLAPAFLHFRSIFRIFWQGSPRNFAKQEQKKEVENGAKMGTLSTYPGPKHKKEAKMRFVCRFRCTWCTLGLHGRSLPCHRHMPMLTQFNPTLHRGTKGNKSMDLYSIYVIQACITLLYDRLVPRAPCAHNRALIRIHGHDGRGAPAGLQ